MTQSLFFVDENNSTIHIIITHVEGNLHIQTGQEQHLVIETEGPVAELRQENSIIIISDSKGTIELWLPNSQNKNFSSDISVTQVSGDVTIEGAEHVVLKDI